MKKYISLFLWIIIIYGNQNAQQTYTYSEKDTVLIENEAVLIGNILYYGATNDTIQIVIKKNDSSIFVVINENLMINYRRFFDSLVHLLIKKYDFIQTDCKYPCNTLFTNKYFDSIIIHKICPTNSLTSVSLASINCHDYHYPEIAVLTSFFINKVKHISQYEHSQHFMFISGSYDKMKSDIKSTLPSPSWIVILDRKDDIVKFQYCDSYILERKRYKVDCNEEF